MKGERNDRGRSRSRKEVQNTGMKEEIEYTHGGRLAMNGIKVERQNCMKWKLSNKKNNWEQGRREKWRCVEEKI